MKTKLNKQNNEYSVIIPHEFIDTLNLKENSCVDISFNLEQTQIIIGQPDEQNIQDIEADEDY